MAGVKVLGAKEAQSYLLRLQGGARAVGGQVVRVGTDVVYAWGIEFGQRRNGALARRLGGSFALTGSFEHVRPRIAPAVRDALPGGPAAVLERLKALGQDVLTGTKTILTRVVYGTPIPTNGAAKARWRRTGNLRRSYHMEAGGPSTGAGLRSRYSRGG